MFTKRTKVYDEIEKTLVEELKRYEVNSEEYEYVIERIARLHEIRNKSKFSVSPDTLAVVLGNLAGILLILNHERLHVVSSKALGFVIRGRV